MGDHARASTKACLACRKVKMRCLIKSDGPSCERCLRKSLECVFQEHRRGRKRGTRILRNKNISRVRDAPLLESGVMAIADPRTEMALRASDGGDSRDMQPPGLLNRAATQGKFSLHNVLNPAIEETSVGQTNSSDISADDPVRLGYVNITIAESLFEHFMSTLNPYISQLDPILHTISYIRPKSSFLFTTILAIAAKTFSSAVYRSLYDHAEKLMAECFRRGEKSVEIAQAMLIMTYWKEPDDARAWVSLGYVIRMGMDLGWHMLMPCYASDYESRQEVHEREVRNIQRTWYVLFVYDRSMSLQTGKPWMIERNEFIESIEAWCKGPMASANDRLLGAFVTLRLLSSEVFKLLRPNSGRAKMAPLHSVESLLAIMKSRLQEWEYRWVSLVETEGRHVFMVRFYGMHLRLQLFSLPLQGILASNDRNFSSSLEVLWTSYSSAIEMLDLICKSSEWLYFAQDSVHVMTAYSAAFLIKLLLSAPESITVQIEPKVVQIIRAASLVFSQQSAPPTSSCALQTRFLERIIANFVERRCGNGSAPEGAPGTATPTINARQISRPTDVLRNSGGSSPNIQFAGDVSNASDSIPHLAQLDLLFDEDETWNNLFAHAGFDIEDGIFFA